MSNNVYGVTEVVGTSETSVEDAVTTAVATASQTLRNLDWFEVSEIRGRLQGGKVGYYQVLLKLGFRYERDD